ncbi:hypothetical protein ACU3L3_06810 [Priestia endophytica]
MAVIADVFDVLLIDGDNDVIGTTTLQDANVEVQVAENDVRAGKGNQLLGVLHSDRDINISLTDVHFRFDWIAKQLGQDIKTGEGKAYATPKFYTVDASGATPKITLDKAPIAGTVAVYDADGEKLTPVTVTEKVVELPVGTAEKVEVRTYQYVTPATTETIQIDNSVFAKGVKAILDTIEIDEATEEATHQIQYEFYNALPSGNFTINTASERQAQTNETTLRVVKPKDSTVVGELKRIPLTV